MVRRDGLLELQRARTHIRLGGVDASDALQPGIDVGDDALRIGAAIGELGNPLDERGGLAEQSLFVRSKSARRTEHQRRR